MSSTMSREKSEAFLAGLHVGILAVAEEGRGPSATPVWYMYVPGGEVRISTQKTSRKLELIKKAGRFTLSVQLAESPYRYVTVEGPLVSLEPTDLERDLRPVAHRYLGEYNGDRYVESIGGDAAADNSILIRMRPERWFSADYG